MWDMDGTLVDTESYWMTAETALVREHGGEWTHEQAMQLVGNGLIDSGRILRDAGVDLEPAEIVDVLTDRVRGLLARDGVPFRPGARELLLALRGAGIPTALVTMSLRRMAEDIVALIDFPAFELIVAGDDVARPKPFPDAYLHAASQLEIEPSRALALEDSPTGLRSALSAGTVAVGIPHIVPLDGCGAHELWATLKGRGVDDVVAAFDRHRTTGTDGSDR
nr:HAD family phosphatase [Microbacterium pseudoresistens]